MVFNLAFLLLKVNYCGETKENILICKFNVFKEVLQAFFSFQETCNNNKFYQNQAFLLPGFLLFGQSLNL